LCLSLVNYLFRGVRWHLFFQPPWPAHHLDTGLTAFTAMSVTPGVGELIRVGCVAETAGSRAHRPFVDGPRVRSRAMALILLVASRCLLAALHGDARRDPGSGMLRSWRPAQNSSQAASHVFIAPLKISA
jgi:hypothetical protein